MGGYKDDRGRFTIYGSVWLYVRDSDGLRRMDRGIEPDQARFWIDGRSEDEDIIYLIEECTLMRLNIGSGQARAVFVNISTLV